MNIHVCARPVSANERPGLSRTSAARRDLCDTDDPLDESKTLIESDATDAAVKSYAAIPPEISEAER